LQKFNALSGGLARLKALGSASRASMGMFGKMRRESVSSRSGRRLGVGNALKQKLRALSVLIESKAAL
jgi:hypothetical protein